MFVILALLSKSFKKQISTAIQSFLVFYGIYAFQAASIVKIFFHDMIDSIVGVDKYCNLVTDR